MLLLITWALFAFSNPLPVQPPLAASDTIKSQDPDSLNRKDAGPIRISSSFRERPAFRNYAPLFGPQTDQLHLEGAIDTLLKKNPILRSPLLKELLIPSKPLANYPANPVLELFNEGLEKDSKFTPFERMSLIAKRYTTCNPTDKSLKSNQLDIIGTALWLMNVLK